VGGERDRAWLTAEGRRGAGSRRARAPTSRRRLGFGVGFKVRLERPDELRPPHVVNLHAARRAGQTAVVLVGRMIAKEPGLAQQSSLQKVQLSRADLVALYVHAL